MPNVVADHWNLQDWKMTDWKIADCKLYLLCCLVKNTIIVVHFNTNAHIIFIIFISDTVIIISITISIIDQGRSYI